MNEPQRGSPEYPERWEDLVRRPRRQATARPPDEFRELFEGSPRHTREVRRVDRAQESWARLGTDPVESYRPDWVEAAGKPRRAKVPPPPRVRHRGGAELEPLVIWHPDDRKTYNDHAFPWGCVCLITTAFGSRGSGVIIGPRHVLTASHVVEWSTDQAETIEVHRHGNGFRARTHATFAMAFTQIGDVGATTLDEDYAVLVTEQRIGDAFGFLGTREYDSGWDDDHLWNTMGYAGDFPQGSGQGLIPTFQQRVALDEDEFDLGSGRAMTTTADAMPRQSGSPMFGTWGDQTQVVAVISATGQVFLSGTENWCSGGSDLNRLVRKARTDFP
ncbi:trypsin-like serine peptidase [Saccharothrix luteola]|uniref:trypsin-like serine peptidase n=1 Tax=Saccharothrix luteola TaxID=2893018 RepID=UPI001E49D7FE|nr:serine protease [Saccharothrix luteola]MCC8245925.1 serine protease [Saccharothrix luteola]MCC8248315.1 serine protease [Saccharothrix luteola]